jgi:hypothetical protein
VFYRCSRLAFAYTQLATECVTVQVSELIPALSEVPWYCGDKLDAHDERVKDFLHSFTGASRCVIMMSRLLAGKDVIWVRTCSQRTMSALSRSFQDKPRLTYWVTACHLSCLYHSSPACWLLTQLHAGEGHRHGRGHAVGSRSALGEDLVEGRATVGVGGMLRMS